MNDDAFLCEPARLDALDRIGLDAAPDETFDRLADLVRTVLGVPVALVTLVEPDRQIFPGARGLNEPWQQRRQTPLSHSFCRHVVATAEPLVVTDARTDDRVIGNLAITDLGVIGYAGMPLTAADGSVLGSLCAIDTEPRRWSEQELRVLSDLAAACSDSLRLRIATHEARDEQRRTGQAYDRSRLLLRAGGALAAATTAAEVITAVRQLVVGTLDPAYVGLSLLDDRGHLAVSTGDVLPPEVVQRWGRYERTDLTPTALAVTRRRMILVPDPDAVATMVPDVADLFAEQGWRSAASVPLHGVHGPSGALTFVWSEPNDLDSGDQAVLATLAGYVTQALQRAQLLEDRSRAAATLQMALLTPLPRHDHLRMAARYRPAHVTDHVGGDWYDAVAVDDIRLAVVIGDVTGHSVQAAAAMSELRSMLRGLLIDRQEPPSAMLRRLEHTSRRLGSPGLASAVLGYVDTDPDGGHTFTWSNAGHPRPMLLHPDGTVTDLEGGDPLLGAVRHASRHSFRVALPPGSRLLLYTDGLVESRHAPIDDGIEKIRRTLAAHPGLAPGDLADLIIGDVQGEDDVAVLVIAAPE